jgi:predicted YcjX-like family ATPase
VVERLSDLFKAYLREARSDQYAISTLPPGRFLMPGDLAGSPALTFAPLDAGGNGSFPRGSLWTMMERRYEAYKSHVVRPFFRDHFARLDRQIVLIDVLTALNGGQPAVADLERAMTEILECFGPGQQLVVEPFVASTASCSPPPRPIISIIRVMTGSRRFSPSSPAGPWRARPMPAPR